MNVGRTTVFVVEGQTARRRPVVVGLSNMQWCELTEGVSEGDELIVSDTRLWEQIDSLVLR